MSKICNYLPGELPPEGYMQRVEWAEAQMRAGIVRSKCPACKKYVYPQEWSMHMRSHRQHGHSGHK